MFCLRKSAKDIRFGRVAHIFLEPRRFSAIFLGKWHLCLYPRCSLKGWDSQALPNEKWCFYFGFGSFSRIMTVRERCYEECSI